MGEVRNQALQDLRDTVAPAIAAGDVKPLRAALEVGATFASFTIRQRTDVAERQFAQWLAAGRPADVREAGVLSTATDKNTRLAGVRDLSDADVLAVFTLPIGVAAWYFADRVKGYGAPKANFALACAGAPGGGACFDSHLLKKYAAEAEASGWAKYATAAYPRTAGVSKREAFITAYESLSTAVYGAEHGHGQWADWLAEYNNGSEGHSLLAETLQAVTR